MAVSVPNRARRAAVLTYCKPKQSVMGGELIVEVRDKRVDPAMPQNLGQELTDRFKSLSLYRGAKRAKLHQGIGSEAGEADESFDPVFALVKLAFPPCCTVGSAPIRETSQ